MQNVSPENLTLGVADFCRSVGICKRTYYTLKSRGEGPPEVRIGRRVVIRREAVDTWLREREGRGRVAAKIEPADHAGAC